MKSLFIDVQVDAQVAGDSRIAATLSEVCPVDIYAQRGDGTLRIVEDNLDECVLCGLCLEAAPTGSIAIRKLYADNVAL